MFLFCFQIQGFLFISKILKSIKRLKDFQSTRWVNKVSISDLLNQDFFLFKSFFPSTNNLFWHFLCLCLNNCQVVGLSNITLQTCCLKDCKVTFKATKQQLIIIIGLLPLKVNLNLNWTKLACTIFIYQNSLLVNKTAILMN